ncbi:hypothetical protein GSN00_07390 [Cylindrospermopsis raciborskii CHAB3438]|uniref:hypothetical protein n=1 Tax=Cylindrospermopsis raciborskii TaxID=77022 RepID=UPI001F0D189C|nr:hypothetical protein [Cylindrospermopsis raciborskii]MCH4904213.1 hypothetical protein [Cylindrospermopsis raciborskii CHAB3438]
MILTSSAIKRVQINLQRRGVRIPSRQIRDNWNSSLSEKENQKRLESLFQAELVPVPPPLPDHVITLDEPQDLPREITIAEKQTISTVAKELGFILPQEELKAIAGSLREDGEITSIREIKEAILKFIAKKGERTRREVDTALSEIATAYAAEQLVSSRLFASSLTNLSKEVKVARGRFQDQVASTVALFVLDD